MQILLPLIDSVECKLSAVCIGRFCSFIGEVPTLEWSSFIKAIDVLLCLLSNMNYWIPV